MTVKPSVQTTVVQAVTTTSAALGPAVPSSAPAQEASDSILVCNKTSSDAFVTLTKSLNGTALGNILENYKIPANDARDLRVAAKMAAGESWSIFGSAASTLTATLSRVQRAVPA